jgi:hypothetical protein
MTGVNPTHRGRHHERGEAMKGNPKLIELLNEGEQNYLAQQIHE